MLFNSYAFIFAFLPVVLVVYYALGKRRWTHAAVAWLAVASLAFYAHWSPADLPLLLGSMAFNYAVGRRLMRGPSRAWLALGVTGDLALLAWFKYAAFFAGSLNAAAGLALPVPAVALPLGISFFTFTQIAFLVDAHRGHATDPNAVRFATFVTFFPHLVAGPILHHGHFMPQLARARAFVFSHRHLAMGLAFFTIGLFKKVMIADTLAPWAGEAFAHPAGLTFCAAWFGALAYTLQLYFDFSGYSDMAVGLGWMLNLQLPLNFASPYQATSIIDFWRRWHMTLSQFLRDYLYIPLGGNRHGEPRRYLNLFLTMLLGGLWHGAGWTFVLWGALHGAYLTANHLWRRAGLRLPPVLGWALTFGAVVVAWVFFRAAHVPDALAMLQAMAGANGLGRPAGRWAHLMLLACLAVAAFAPNSQALVARMRPGLGLGLGLGMVAMAIMAFLDKPSEFLYFQF